MNLNQVTIYTDKPTESVEFYQKLGLRLIVDSAPRYARFEFPEDDATLSVHETNEVFSASNYRSTFRVSKTGRTGEELKQTGNENVIININVLKAKLYSEINFKLEFSQIIFVKSL